MEHVSSAASPKGKVSRVNAASRVGNTFFGNVASTRVQPGNLTHPSAMRSFSRAPATLRATSRDATDSDANQCSLLKKWTCQPRWSRITSELSDRSPWRTVQSRSVDECDLCEEGMTIDGTRWTTSRYATCPRLETLDFTPLAQTFRHRAGSCSSGNTKLRETAPVSRAERS